VEAVLADWRTAPIDQRLRATLGFLEKVTLAPGDVTSADTDAVRAAGVSDEAIEDALAVCVSFNLIDRLADSFAFTPISEIIGKDALLEYEAKFLETGYV
jgi:alkylhydroperoxidase family enzyme